MKKFIFLLFVFSISFCSTFGNSEIRVSREWVISDLSGDESEIEFTGMLVINNSNQKVLEVYAEPPLNVSYEGEEIFVEYSGPVENNTTFNARAIVLVDYDANLKNDGSISGERIEGSPLVMWNEDITELSDVLVVPGSTLETIESVLAWMNSNIVYDLRYYGSSKSAQVVVREKRGVCVEFTHLFISIMNSLGLETRYVGGYVMADDWQPHSWAEVYIDGQWIAVDPTFNEAGILDTSHVALSYGNDSSDLYDKVLAYGDSILSSSTKLSIVDENEDSKGVAVDLLFNNQTDTLVIEVKNTRDDYVFGSYNRALPEEYGGEKDIVLLLEPGERYREYVVFPQELMTGGYSYTIPARVSFNDASDMENIFIVKEKTREDADTCALPLAVLLIPIGIFFSRIIKNN